MIKLLLSIYGALFLYSHFAHAFPEAFNDVSTWTTHLPHGPAMIASLAAQEKQSLIPMDLQFEDNKRFTFGFNFPMITPLSAEMFQEIHKKYLSTHHRPLVADIGAGGGYTTWKIIAAGGNCTAIEAQKAAADQIGERLAFLSKFILPKNEEISRVSTVLNENFLSLDETSLTEKFDFVYISNVIHFLTPEQVPIFLKKVFQITKPGGKIFVSVHTGAPQTALKALERKSIELHYKNLSKARPFPGYMVLQVPLIEYPGRVPHEGLGQAFNHEDVSVEYRLPPWVVVQEAATQKEGYTERLGYKGMHYFLWETLRSSFEAEGFNVLEQAYANPMGQLVLRPVDMEELINNNLVSLFISVQKP